MSYGVHPYLVDFSRDLPSDSKSLEGYGLEERIGRTFLSNEMWSAMRMSWFDSVDAALAKAGSDVRLSKYFYRGAPCPIIPPDDFPMIGHFKPEEIPDLRAKLESIEVPGDEGRAVAEVLGWLNRAHVMQGIVTFYY